MKMINFATTVLTLCLGVSSMGASTGTAQTLPSVSTGNVSEQSSTTLSSTEELGVKMELLWCAGTKAYDATVAEDLIPHTPEILEPGKFYEVAIMVSNDTDDAIAVPWGMDYTIVLPRIIAPEESENPEDASADIDGRVTSREGNDDAGSTRMYVDLKVSEPVALRYIDFSNSLFYSGETNRHGFNWETDSRPLDENNIILQGTLQGLQPHTYRVVTFLVEACPLAEWEDFIATMHDEPVAATVLSVTEGTHWTREYESDVEGENVPGERSYTSSMYREDTLDIDFTINVPQWLRDLVNEDGGWWRIMVRPRFDESGSVGVELRFENHNCTYVAATDQVELNRHPDTWSSPSLFKGATFSGCETYAKAAYWGTHGADYRWASLAEEDWGDLLSQEELHITLQMRQ